MGQSDKDPEQAHTEPAPVSRRHRPASEIRFPSRDEHGALPTGALTDELRQALWETIHSFVFEEHPELDAWTNGVLGRPAVRRLWAAAPLYGDPAAIPEDAVELLDSWFSLVEPGEVYAFVESALVSLDPLMHVRFSAACNAVLERGMSDHRFLGTRLLPIASRADIFTIERALTACQQKQKPDVEQCLVDALDRLALKPDPDCRGSIQEAIRAVSTAAYTLTGERHLSLSEALSDLEERGLIEPSLTAAYAELFSYAASPARRTTTDDARLIVVMCAGFLVHLLK